MLGTLMKYEFKAVGRLLLPLYGAWLVAAIMLGLSLGGDGTGNSPLFVTISGVLYGGACVAAVILTIILLIQRFYKNLLGNEGYLMFALPVSTGKHLTNKVVSGAVWTVAGVLVGVLSAFAIVISIEGFGSFFDEAGIWIGDINLLLEETPTAILFIFEFIILMLAAAAEFVVKVYAAIAVGHQWGNHRALGAILAYIGFGIIESIIGNILSAILSSDAAMTFESLTDNLSVMTQVHLTMLMVLAGIAIVTAIYWFVCWKLLNSRLNLE